MPRDNPAPALLLENRLTQLIERHHRWLLTLPVILLLLGFNGKWRIGLDSSMYRGLALNVARGNGYTFGDWAPKQVYPGYPYILAGIERVFGPATPLVGMPEQARLVGPSAATAVSDLFSLGCAFVALFLTFKIIRLHYPLWIATTIAVGVGTNAVFINQSAELMTDMPFLAAIMVALYAWERLRDSEKSIPIAAMLFTIGGMTAAALLRPMFWVLLIAWVVVCAWELMRGRRIVFYSSCLLVLALIAGVTLELRPRGYEAEARDQIWLIKTHYAAELYSVLRDQLPTAMFGEQLSPCSMLGSALVVFSMFFLLRRHLLWVLLAFGTFAVTIVLSDEPRYYMQVIPILMLGWLMMTLALARRFSTKVGQIILSLSLALVLLNNLSATVNFFIEQHRSDYLGHYKKGQYLSALEMAEQIRLTVKPQQKVLGPSGPIMSIFSGRHVLSQKEVLPRGDGPKSPDIYKAEGFSYVVFPATLYRTKEPVVARLIAHHLILQRAPLRKVAIAGHEKDNMVLATARFSTVAPQDWRRLPPGWRPQPAAAKQAAKQAKALKARRQRKRERLLKQAATKAATTQTSSTTPSPIQSPVDWKQMEVQFLRAMTTMLSPL